MNLLVSSPPFFFSFICLSICFHSRVSRHASSAHLGAVISSRWRGSFCFWPMFIFASSGGSSMYECIYAPCTRQHDTSETASAFVCRSRVFFFLPWAGPPPPPIGRRDRDHVSQGPRGKTCRLYHVGCPPCPFCCCLLRQTTLGLRFLSLTCASKVLMTWNMEKRKVSFETNIWLLFLDRLQNLQNKTLYSTKGTRGLLYGK